MSKIVLVTDELVDIKAADISNRDLEKNMMVGTQKIIESLREAFCDVVHYSSIQDFTENVESHKGDIIFPMYYGINKATSKGLIPALCECFNIDYVGADAYTHILCNDKNLSKMYAARFNILSSKDVLINVYDNLADIKNKLSQLNLPVIAKPNHGGGSTGISVNSICHTLESATELAMNLARYHEMAIIVEEYIPGNEIDFVIAGSKTEIIMQQEVQLFMDGDDYFESKIWGFETKKIDDSSIDMRPSNLIPHDTCTHMIDLFQSFDKAEFMRIDGRLYEGQFYLIEMSPDAYLGDDCAVYEAFKHHGYSHVEMLRKLVQNAHRS